jgi:competence ComEA-like helix-hairpin-helix protein
MLALTPAERRGALTVALLLVIGAGYDLWRAHAPLASLEPATTARVGTDPQSADTSASTVTAPAESVRAAASPRLDLNHADAAALDRLPGIGPVLADRIIAHRTQHGPFQEADDLQAVPGIGQALFKRLAPLVTVGDRR